MIKIDDPLNNIKDHFGVGIDKDRGKSIMWLLVKHNIPDDQWQFSLNSILRETIC